VSVPVYPEYKDSGVAWLGEVPSHWEVSRLKRACDIFPSNVDKKSADGERTVRLCNYTDVYYNNVIETDLPFMAATASDEQITKFTLKAGDTIITKDSETPDDIARSAYVPVDMPGIVCGYHLSMVRPKAGITGAFIKQYFDDAASRAYFHVSANGLTRVGLGQYAVDNAPIALPPLQEQTAIAAFLDRETAKIDALVAEQQRLITLLKEKRQAVISHAVTKGLNSNAPMKDSGIEWLGEIPAHWAATAIKRLIETATSGPRGWSELAADDGSFFFQSQNIGRNMNADFSEGKRITVPEGPDAERAKLRVDDVVVCITGGRTGAVAHIRALEEDAFINQHVCLVRPVASQALGRYLAYGLFGLQGQEQLGLAMYGLKQGLNLENVREVQLPLPPVNDQAAIVEYLDAYSGRVLGLQQDAQSAITLLQERRAALISAAVTGKIDVRTSVAANNVIPISRARKQQTWPSLRAVVGAYAIRELGSMGRMAVMKAGYLAEAQAGLSGLNGRYERNAAGPYDQSLITAMERGAGEVCSIKTIDPQVAGMSVTYDVPSGFQAPAEALEALAGDDRATGFRSMLSLLKGIGRDGVEAVATIYAVWNDLIAAGKAANDDAVCNGVLNDWHDEKRHKFKRTDLDHWLAWMRRNNFVPTGKAPRTDHQGSLFA
jgi:type I restriction enzyme, S subunit